MSIDLYDVKELTSTMADGVFTSSHAVIEVRKIDVQPIQWSQREASNRIEIELGGIKYIPTFYGFAEKEAKVSATHWITTNSGSTNLMVLRTYEFEDHLEIDLVEAEARG